MNGENNIPSYFKAIIEECFLRATEEDLEGVPLREKFHVISNEAGMLLYILTRVSKRDRIAELSGPAGASSTIAWLASAVCDRGGEVTAFETNPRRLLKLQNCLCRSKLSSSVRLSSQDPLWFQQGNINEMTDDVNTLLESPFNELNKFDCIALSMKELDSLKRVQLAWDILAPSGLLVLTDSLLGNQNSFDAVKEFLERKTQILVWVNTSEGLGLAYKMSGNESTEMLEKPGGPVSEKADMVLSRLAYENSKEGSRLWAIPPETGKFLWMVTRLVNANRVLEIGTSGGYSSIWIASAIENTAGSLITLESDPSKIDIALKSISDSGLSEKIKLLQGNAFQTIPSLNEQFDVVFLDAFKDDYIDFLEIILPILKPEGILIADNVISHASQLKSYVDTVQHHPKLISVSVAVGSGLEVTLKLQ